MMLICSEIIISIIVSIKEINMKNKNVTSDKPVYSHTKTDSRKIIIAIIIVCIAIIIMIAIGLFQKDTTSAISSSTRTVANLFSVLFIVIIIPICFAVIIAPIYLIKFKSIKDEVQFTKEKYPNNAHTVIAILCQTASDLFALAYFEKNNEIRPSVYTKHKNKITLMDLRIKNTYYKKLYLGDYDEFKYIRIQRLENKTTKTKMIFFASTINNLQIRINDQLIPKIDCGNKLGNFSIYGIIENDDNHNINTVNINGCDYSIIETPVQYYFINKNEI